MENLAIALQDSPGKHNNVELTWWNVAFASLFIIINRNYLFLLTLTCPSVSPPPY
jgi:hypothetical protein